MRKIFGVVLLGLFILLPGEATSHGGGTDWKGCHAGSKPYHCHNSKRIYTPSRTIQKKPVIIKTIVPAPKPKKVVIKEPINEYSNCIAIRFAIREESNVRKFNDLVNIYIEKECIN